MNIDVIKLLDVLKIDYKSAGTDNVRIYCLNAQQHNNGIDSDPSLQIHIHTGVMHCFSCGYKGYITTLVKKHLNLADDMDVLYFMHQFALGESLDTSRLTTRTSTGNAEKKEENKEIEYPKHRSAINNPYLIGRGFSNKEIEKWNIGIINDTNPKFMRNNGWIYIPIYQDGELKNYFLRNPFGKDKIYGPFPKKTLLAGYDKITNYDKIYVLEGIFKAMAFKKTRSQAVASLGNQLSKKQIALLKKFKTVVIVPDNDSAGFVLVKTAKPLMYNVDLRVCELPLNKKDADECTLDELLFAQLKELPIEEYLSKKLSKIA
jgi:DNA primase